MGHKVVVRGGVTVTAPRDMHMAKILFTELYVATQVLVNGLSSIGECRVMEEFPLLQVQSDGLMLRQR